MVTFEDVVNNVEVKELMKNAQKQLDVLGYTEHSSRHVGLVAERAAYVLKTLGYDASDKSVTKSTDILLVPNEEFTSSKLSKVGPNTLIIPVREFIDNMQYYLSKI